ncbi:hypothetical protein F511_36550 [Dorcoceras hygrometricum]|uniref:Dystroglycan-like n=1 Tax=Dorcoceras hygrometricum TaxID=472368 RepID=A0A2Z7CJ01_9LAMI|nr:hypothetical protein F511_36550 [Dorcoceras hygrometricum]
MASSLISSYHHIDFDSVFGIDDTGLVQMFETFIATGLKEFLGCPAVFYEAALTEFFENSSVRDGVVVSTIRGTAIEISENIFATTFGLSVDGLTDLSEVPKNLVSVRRAYAGSFDAVTRDRFMLMTAITFDVIVNWSSLLFGVLQYMVTPGSRQAKGFTIQICVLLKNVPGLVLGESRAFPASRVLTEKTVHRYVTINEKVGMEETADAPRVQKTPVKKTVSTKRPVGDGEEAPIVKKKRTTKGKPVVIAQEAVPLQSVKATTDASTEQPPARKRKSQKRKRRLILEGVDEIVDSAPEQPAAEAATDVQETEVENEQAVTAADSVTVETVVERVDEPVPESAVADVERVGEQPAVDTVEEATTDDADHIIQQVLGQLDSVTTTDSGDQPAGTDAETIPWFDLPFVLATRDSERLFETASDSEDDMDPDVGNQALPEVDATIDSFISDPDEEMEPVVEEQSADEAMSLEDILMSIPVEVPLPSAGVEITKITMGKEIKITGVDERTWYLASLPQIPVNDKGKEPLLVIDEVEKFFNSFSLKKLETLQIDESYFEKEALVLSWVEADSTRVALNRKVYILLKYREVLVRKFLESWKLNFVPGEGSSTTDLKLAVGPQPLWLRNHNSGLVQRIMVKRLATSPHDPLGITDSACKNQLVVVSVQYGPFITYIPIRSTTIGKSRVTRDPIAMHTSWRSNSDIASVTRVSMTFRVVRTNQYNQDLGHIHSKNDNHLESPNEGSSIDHQVTIYLHAQNITMFPTNETRYFASQILVSISGGLILILTAQSTRNIFRMHSDY